MTLHPFPDGTSLAAWLDSLSREALYALRIEVNRRLDTAAHNPAQLALLDRIRSNVDAGMLAGSAVRVALDEEIDTESDVSDATRSDMALVNATGHHVCMCDRPHPELAAVPWRGWRKCKRCAGIIGKQAEAAIARNAAERGQ